MAFNGKCLFLVTCMIALMIKSSAGECATRLRNQVLTEGQTLTFNTGNAKEGCQWSLAPSDQTFNIRKNVTDENGSVEQKYGSSYRLDGSNLVMSSARTEPGESPYATAGLYIFECPGDDCITAAKVVVIQIGPICSCAYDPDSKYTSFTVTIVYADTTKNDMYPTFNCTLNGVLKHSDKPLPVRQDKYRFVASTAYKTPHKSLGVLRGLECTVRFDKPSQYPIANVDQQAPDYAASCSFDQPCN